MHQVLKGEEPDAVGLAFAEHGHGLGSVETSAEAAGGGPAEFPDAVEWARIEAGGGRVGLGLQADADVLDGVGEDGVEEAREGAGGVVLGVGEGFGGRG